MELKTGMYVRDNEYGIGRVTDICACVKCEERGFYEPTISYSNHCEYVTSYIRMQDYEGRASNSMIDILEAGDYVNGRPVKAIAYPMYNETDNGLEGIGNRCVIFGKWDYIEESEIKTIVTKEQFERMKYEVK